jgi:phage terminase Nu1 subunit (DNA packaging protein)
LAVVVGTKDLAKILKVDVRSVQTFVVQGMPRVARGKFDLTLCVPWYVDRERAAARASKGLNDLDRARERKARAEAEERELRMRINLGEMVPLQVLEDRVGTLCDRLMAVLQNLPGTYGFHLERAGVDAGKAEAVLETVATEITSALRSVADLIEREGAEGELADDGSAEQQRA